MYALSDALFTAALEAAEANYSIFLCKLYGRAAAEVNYSLFSKANFYGCAAAEVNYSIFSNRTFTAAQGGVFLISRKVRPRPPPRRGSGPQNKNKNKPVFDRYTAVTTCQGAPQAKFLRW